jgi:hypothetical protein
VLLRVSTAASACRRPPTLGSQERYFSAIGVRRERRAWRRAEGADDPCAGIGGEEGRWTTSNRDRGSDGATRNNMADMTGMVWIAQGISRRKWPSV